MVQKEIGWWMSSVIITAAKKSLPNASPADFLASFWNFPLQKDCLADPFDFFWNPCLKARCGRSPRETCSKVNVLKRAYMTCSRGGEIIEDRIWELEKLSKTPRNTCRCSNTCCTPEDSARVGNEFLQIKATRDCSPTWKLNKWRVKKLPTPRSKCCVFW